MSIKRKLDVDSFSTSGDIRAPRWLRWHDLVSPGDEVYEKIFFRQTILNGPIREKNMFPEIPKIFALWPDPGSTLK